MIDHFRFTIYFMEIYFFHLFLVKSNKISYKIKNVSWYWRHKF